MVMRQHKGGWAVCELRQVSAVQDKIFYLSRRFEIREEALKERDRMSSLPEFQGRPLDVTYWRRELAKKRKSRDDRRRSRH
jgi:hypothetical protein